MRMRPEDILEGQVIRLLLFRYCKGLKDPQGKASTTQYGFSF